MQNQKKKKIVQQQDVANLNLTKNLISGKELEHHAKKTQNVLLKKECKWRKIGNNCFTRNCCSSTLVNGQVLVGSTKCADTKTHCSIKKKVKCSWSQQKNHCQTKKLLC